MKFGDDTARFFSMTDDNFTPNDWQDAIVQPIELWKYLNSVINELLWVREDARRGKQYNKLSRVINFHEYRLLTNNDERATNNLFYVIDGLIYWNNLLADSIMHGRFENKLANF